MKARADMMKLMLDGRWRTTDELAARFKLKKGTVTNWMRYYREQGIVESEYVFSISMWRLRS